LGALGPAWVATVSTVLLPLDVAKLLKQFGTPAHH
jgi:hypothetical protein